VRCTRICDDHKCCLRRLMAGGRQLGPGNIPGAVYLTAGSVRGPRIHVAAPRATPTITGRGDPLRQASRLEHAACTRMVRKPQLDVTGHMHQEVPGSPVAPAPKSSCAHNVHPWHQAAISAVPTHAEQHSCTCWPCPPCTRGDDISPGGSNIISTACTRCNTCMICGLLLLAASAMCALLESAHLLRPGAMLPHNVRWLPLCSSLQPPALAVDTRVMCSCHPPGTQQARWSVTDGRYC
jgi:hypothetical protein